jgi:Xaa-Pro aminopeptidase
MSWIKDIRLSRVKDSINTLASVFDEKGLKGRTIGLSQSDTPAVYYLLLKFAFPNAKIVDSENALDKLTANKSNYDKEMIRKTAAIVDSGMRAAISTCAEGRREYEVGLEAEKAMVDCGAEVGASTVYPYVFVGSGTTIMANIRSYNYTAKKLEKGEMFLSTYRCATRDTMRTSAERL